LRVDLHCHSNFSDGTLPPAAVATRAKYNGVNLWALTDHDELSGLSEARLAAKKCSLTFVSGVEISTTWASKTIHIVGLQIDENNIELVKGLAILRNARKQRAHTIAERLATAGVPSALEGALKYASNKELISRTHFARYLIEIGQCSDINKAFRNFLGEGKSGYVPQHWASLEQAVCWINSAGGVAVVAHPGRYKLSALELDNFLSEFKQLGGSAIEVITGSHTPDQYIYYAKVATSYGFLASCGSDFHSPENTRVDLGSLPPLPSTLKPVWYDW